MHTSKCGQASACKTRLSPRCILVVAIAFRCLCKVLQACCRCCPVSSSNASADLTAPNCVRHMLYQSRVFCPMQVKESLRHCLFRPTASPVTSPASLHPVKHCSSSAHPDQPSDLVPTALALKVAQTALPLQLDQPVPSVAWYTAATSLEPKHIRSGQGNHAWAPCSQILLTLLKLGKEVSTTVYADVLDIQKMPGCLPVSNPDAAVS